MRKALSAFLYFCCEKPRAKTYTLRICPGPYYFLHFSRRDVEDAVPYDRQEHFRIGGRLYRIVGLRAADSRPYGQAGRLKAPFFVLNFLLFVYNIYI